MYKLVGGFGIMIFFSNTFCTHIREEITDYMVKDINSNNPLTVLKRNTFRKDNHKFKIFVVTL